MYNQTFLRQFPIVVETGDYILLGDGCAPITPADRSYLERLNDTLLTVYNYTVSEDPCEILFRGNCPFTSL